MAKQKRKSGEKLKKKKAGGDKNVQRKKAVKVVAAAVKKSGGKEMLRRTKIRVIGIGGGGGTIAAEIAPYVRRVDFWTANTDSQALKKTGKICRRFLFGQKITGGLGCGSDPRMGQLAAKQAGDKITALFRGVDLCILISCLGGGTGSGAISEFARLAKEAGCITLGVFTLPFRFEGDKKMQAAKQALARTIPHLSASVIFPNEKIFQVLDAQTGFQAALSATNTILATDLKNLMETVYLPGLINIDFADLRATLAGEGKLAYLASASGEGDNRAENTCKALLAHPLNEYDARGADRILFNITSENNISVAEVEYISKTISALNPRAKIIFGISQRVIPAHGLTITLLATGVAQPAKSPENKRVKHAKKIGRKEKPAAVQTLPPPAEEKEAIKLAAKQAVAKVAKKESTGKEKKQKTEKAKMSQKKAKLEQKKRATKSRRKEETAKKTVVSKGNGAVELIVGADANQGNDREGLFSKLRKNALDLKREAEVAEQEQLANERKWDVPAFLRRRV